MTNKKTSKKGVTRKPPKTAKKNSHSKNSGARHLLELTEFRVVARIVIALAFAAGILWLASKPVGENQRAQDLADPREQDDDRTTSNRFDGLNYDDFTFYSKLKDFEVKVEQENPYAAQDDGYITQYLIQAGAFRRYDRAEEQLVTLTLLDVDARIDRDRDWYRLLIGPLSSRSAMSSARERLLDNGIDAQVMKHRVKR